MLAGMKTPAQARSTADTQHLVPSWMARARYKVPLPIARAAMPSPAPGPHQVLKTYMRNEGEERGGEQGREAQGEERKDTARTKPCLNPHNTDEY